MTQVLDIKDKNTSVTPLDMLNNAVSGGADLDVIDKLMTLQERWEANQAKKAFVVAMSEFREQAPNLIRNKDVSFATSKGVTGYKHTTLGYAIDAIRPALVKCGLSHSWKQSQADGAITVKCVVTHILGHSEETELTAGADASGNKNAIQAIGSTVSYLQRYTLFSILGLASCEDDDGNLTEPTEYINKDQVKIIEDTIKANKIPKEMFIEWLVYKGAANDVTIEEIPNTWFNSCIARLNKKKVAV